MVGAEAPILIDDNVVEHLHDHRGVPQYRAVNREGTTLENGDVLIDTCGTVWSYVGTNDEYCLVVTHNEDGKPVTRELGLNRFDDVYILKNY